MWFYSPRNHGIRANLSRRQPCKFHVLCAFTGGACALETRRRLVTERGKRKKKKKKRSRNLNPGLTAWVIRCEFRKNRTAGAEFQWIGPMLFLFWKKKYTSKLINWNTVKNSRLFQKLFSNATNVNVCQVFNKLRRITIDCEYFVYTFSPSMQLTNNKRCTVRLTSVFH